MKIIITEQLPELEDAVRAAGHEVVSSPEIWASTYTTENFEHPRDYPFGDIASRHRPDIAFLINPNRVVPFRGGKLNEFGYFKQHTRQARRGGCTLVMYATDDPRTWNYFDAGMNRGCVCRPLGDSVAVYISSVQSVVDNARQKMRAALWVPGGSTDSMWKAIQHGRSGQIYSPKRCAGMW